MLSTAMNGMRNSETHPIATAKNSVLMILGAGSSMQKMSKPQGDTTMQTSILSMSKLVRFFNHLRKKESPTIPSFFLHLTMVTCKMITIYGEKANRTRVLLIFR